MNLTNPIILSALALLLVTMLGESASADDRVTTANGILEGTTDPESGIRSFKGIPFAAPPVGDLRWKPPQPVKNWEGVRRADKFGPRAMQPPIFDDMVFRSDGMSEDCLYLNVWTPAKSGKERLPVLVYFYGGGFAGGDGSEPRYDGASMARRGIVAVTVNYRLGVFGFLAHPELTQESPHHASGNYGLLDQNAALRWVHHNIAAFGGDPKRVTIAGESAGSLSVSAQMASPLSRGLIAGAIGESGALIKPVLPPVPLVEGEALGVQFAKDAGASSLTALRAMSAEQILSVAAKGNAFRFVSTIEGYFLPKLPVDIFASGEQAHVPLLLGWNSAESDYQAILKQDAPTPENFAKAVRRLYADRADQVLKLYTTSTSEEVLEAATDLASDRFIAYSTWKWYDLHSKTGDKPVYRYFYAHPRPLVASAGGQQGGGTGDPAPAFRGAEHSAEIEYAMGNLATNKVFAWTPEDYKVSEVMQGFFANFVKTGNPNGPGLPNWPAANREHHEQIMRLDVNSHAEPESHRERYLFLDQDYKQGH
jgi:para-nitrobenzyl esterase